MRSTEQTTDVMLTDRTDRPAADASHVVVVVVVEQMWKLRRVTNQVYKPSDRVGLAPLG